MEYRSGSHTVYHVEYYFVFLARTDPQQGPGRWVTKYQYKVLTGDTTSPCECGN